MSSTVDMVTAAEVKARMEISGTSRDTAIGSAITAASRAINAHCHRELTPKTASATRRIQVTGSLVDLSPYDLRSATAVIFDPDAQAQTLVAHTDYELFPAGADALTATYTEIMLSRFLSLQTTKMQNFGRADLSVAGAWGAWDTADVPESVKGVCITVVGSWLDKAVAAYGDSALMDGVRGGGVPASYYQALSIPKAAWSLLTDLGLQRFSAV